MRSSYDIGILSASPLGYSSPVKTAAPPPSSSLPTQVNNSSGQWFSPDSTSGQIFDNVIWDRNASTGSNLMGWGATLGSALIPGGAVARGLWLAARHGRKAYQVAQAANRARQAAQAAKAAKPMTTLSRAGQIGTTATKGTGNAILGYQAGLAGGAAAGTAADAVGLGGNKTNTIGEPTYGERATNLSAMAYAPLFRMGGRLGTFTNPVLGTPAKGARTWGRFAGDAATYGAGMLGAERATDAASSGLSALQPDKADRAVMQFAKDQGIDTADKGSMQSLKDQINASGIVKRNLTGQFAGLRNHTDAMGSPVTDIDFAGMKTQSGGRYSGSDRIDLTDVLGRNMGIQTPQQRNFQDQFNRQPLADQAALKEYYDPETWRRYEQGNLQKDEAVALAAPIQRPGGVYTNPVVSGTGTHDLAQPISASEMRAGYNGASKPLRLFATEQDGERVEIPHELSRHVFRTPNGYSLRLVHEGQWIDIPLTQ